MNSAEQQFEVLLAHVVTKVNFVLTQQETVPAMGLLLTADGNTEVALNPVENEGPLETHLDQILDSLRESVAADHYLATCLCFPDYDKGSVMVFWENRENLCTKVIIPVNTEAVPFLDIDKAEMGDGIVSIFPAVDA